MLACNRQLNMTHPVLLSALNLASASMCYLFILIFSIIVSDMNFHMCAGALRFSHAHCFLSSIAYQT